jgi:hypothetical protein
LAHALNSNLNETTEQEAAQAEKAGYDLCCAALDEQNSRDQEQRQGKLGRVKQGAHLTTEESGRSGEGAALCPKIKI